MPRQVTHLRARLPRVLKVEKLWCSYETRLAAETETGLQLRGELGILRKKVGCFQGRIEELQAQLQHSRDLEAGLHQVRVAPLCALPAACSSMILVQKLCTSPPDLKP